jgi:hypothetical protein
VSIWNRPFSQIEIFAFILSRPFRSGKTVRAHPIENKSVDVTTIQFFPAILPRRMARIVPLCV